MTEQHTEVDHLAEFDQVAKQAREKLLAAGREVNYLRHLLSELRPYLPKDHPWLPGIDEQIALTKPCERRDCKDAKNQLHDYMCAHANLLLKIRDCPNCDAGGEHS